MLRLGLRKPGIEKRVRDGGEFDATCWLDIVQGEAQQFRGYFLKCDLVTALYES